MATEERDRLETWLNAWGSGVLKLCRMSLGDPQLAEDALQETFLRVWRNLPRLETAPEEHVKAWVFRVAINVCKDMKRSAWWRHVDTRVALEDLPEPAGPVDDTARELTAMVAALPDALRRPVLLHHLTGLTLTETARVLSVSRPTLNKRLKEAYRRLAVEWEGEDEA